MSEERDAPQMFLVARNRQPDTKLPYLLKLPLEGGLVLKAREVWPRTARVYCHPFEEAWPEEPEIVEEVPVLLCRRRGAAIDLMLDRPRLARSQFVFTEVKGRLAIFWQTQKTARTANPGGRVPRRRALAAGFTIAVDSRERYGYRFTGRDVQTERAALPAGDYAVRDDDGVILAAVERKNLENMASTLSDGTLAFQLQRLAELPLAAVVVEGRYPGAAGLPARTRRLARRHPGSPAGPLPRGPGCVRRLPTVRRGMDVPVPGRRDRRCTRRDSGLKTGHGGGSPSSPFASRGERVHRHGPSELRFPTPTGWTRGAGRQTILD